MAMVKEKSSSTSFRSTRGCSAIATAGNSDGEVAYCSNGSSGWPSESEFFRLRARYDATRSATAPRQTGPGGWSDARIPRDCCAGGSAEELAGARCESQKVQTRTPDGRIAPHCKQVLFTGEFCAADASTPVWSESEHRIACGEKVNGENCGGRA